MLFQLKHPYVSVSNGPTVSYGGNQMCSENKTERTVVTKRESFPILWKALLFLPDAGMIAT